jgi:methionyl aminopeptidase
MSITNNAELEGMQAISLAVAKTLKAMREYAKPGISTKELDDYGGNLLAEMGAKSAPYLTYQFPGFTCISVNKAFAHGIPSDSIVLQEGDLVNIDVSAELNGYWSDNGGSFIVGEDIHQRQPLVDLSKRILYNALEQVKGGVRIAEIGRLIETQAKKANCKVIQNLTGHGVGKSLHEDPHEIPNYYDRHNTKRFRKNSVVAIETFIATHSTLAVELEDGWTFVGNKGGYVAQHEHTILITDSKPIILTAANEI